VYIYNIEKIASVELRTWNRIFKYQRNPCRRVRWIVKTTYPPGVVFLFGRKSSPEMLYFIIIIHIYILPPSAHGDHLRSHPQRGRYHYYYYVSLLSYFSPLASYFNLFRKFVSKNEDGFTYIFSPLLYILLTRGPLSLSPSVSPTYTHSPSRVLKPI